MNIGILIYDEAEVLDFAGPFEVFSVAARIQTGDHVFLLSESGQAVRARNGFTVVPAYGIQDHPELDVLVVPGGVHRPQLQRTKLIQWLRDQARHASVMASVCTGAFLLAEAGLLDGHPVTTHWEDIQSLKASYPALQVIEDRRWTRSGNIATSAGISAGIDMSLALLAQWHGQQLADATARQMEYDPIR